MGLRRRVIMIPSLRPGFTFYFNLVVWATAYCKAWLALALEGTNNYGLDEVGWERVCFLWTGGFGQRLWFFIVSSAVIFSFYYSSATCNQIV